MQVHTPTSTNNSLQTPHKSGMTPGNLPSNLNLGFGDSASQRPNEVTEEGGIPSINELKNRPFASNLENAKILAQITKMRIDKLGINPRKGSIDYSYNTDYSKEYEK